MRYWLLRSGIYFIGLLGLSSVGIEQSIIAQQRTSPMDKTIFRQYDIRGIVGKELDLDCVYRLGRSLVAYLVKTNPAVKSVVVGMDGRTHSPQIRDDIIRAFVDSGVNVISIGICPTPVIYFALHRLPVQAGVMVTASHNGKEYNGLKICLGSQMVWGDELQTLYQMYEADEYLASTDKGSVEERELIPAYVDYLTEQCTGLKEMQLPVIFDCGNGTAGPVIKMIADRLGWRQAQLMYAEVDGAYPHHEADPTVEKNMRDLRRQLQTTKAAVGIGFDGDSDRMAAMTPNGRLIPGDEMLAILAAPIAKDNAGAGVVCDVSCSDRVPMLLSQWGARSVMVPTGSPYVKGAMRGEGVLFGGELSGHYMFADRYFGYDDGIYAALRLLEIMVQSGKTIDELAAIFPRWCSSPPFRPYCADECKKKVAQEVRAFFEQCGDVDLLAIDGVRVRLPYGSAAIRASNTQPALSVRFEAETLDGFVRLRDQLASILKDHVDVAPLYLFDGGRDC